MSKPVLLIADPDIMRRNAAFRRCADRNVRVLSAADLTDALRLAQTHAPDRVAIASDLAAQASYGALAQVLALTGAQVVIYGPPQPGLTLARVANPDQMVAALLGDLTTMRAAQPSSNLAGPDDSSGVILIGASTGGITALEAVLHDFSVNCPPTLVVQHIRPGFAEGLIRRLDKMLQAKVRAAQDNVPLERGVILVAADGERHLSLALRGGNVRTQLCEGPALSGHRPSVDMLFGSAAELSSRLDLRAALLTGMGSDGAAGMCALRQAGALTVAQDRDSSVVWGMPRVAVEMGGACEVLPLPRIGQALLRPMPSPRTRSPA